jgi:hypothetical protein
MNVSHLLHPTNITPLEFRFIVRILSVTVITAAYEFINIDRVLLQKELWVQDSYKVMKLRQYNKRQDRTEPCLIRRSMTKRK